MLQAIFDRLSAREKRRIIQREREASQRDLAPAQLNFMLDSLPFGSDNSRVIPELESYEIGIIINLRFSADHTLPQLEYLIRGAQDLYGISPEPFRNPLRINSALAQRCLRTWDARAQKVTFAKIAAVTRGAQTGSSAAASASSDFRRALKYFEQFASAHIYQYEPGSNAIRWAF